MALNDADITSYLTGEEDLCGHLMHGLPQYRVHLESGFDRARASEILLALGAAPEEAPAAAASLSWLMIAAAVTVAALLLFMTYAPGATR